MIIKGEVFQLEDNRWLKRLSVRMNSDLTSGVSLIEFDDELIEITGKFIAGMEVALSLESGYESNDLTVSGWIEATPKEVETIRRRIAMDLERTKTDRIKKQEAKRKQTERELAEFKRKFPQHYKD